MSKDLYLSKLKDYIKSQSFPGKTNFSLIQEFTINGIKLEAGQFQTLDERYQFFLNDREISYELYVDLRNFIEDQFFSTNKDNDLPILINIIEELKLND